MYGAYGRIVDVHPNGVGTANPSPVIEVETDWPPGMSGGPVFNQAGDVVGIVSRSIRAEGIFPAEVMRWTLVGHTTSNHLRQVWMRRDGGCVGVSSRQ
jgi:hypothetical protein